MMESNLGIFLTNPHISFTILVKQQHIAFRCPEWCSQLVNIRVNPASWNRTKFSMCNFYMAQFASTVILEDTCLNVVYVNSKYATALDICCFRHEITGYFCNTIDADIYLIRHISVHKKLCTYPNKWQRKPYLPWLLKPHTFSYLTCNAINIIQGDFCTSFRNVMCCWYRWYQFVAAHNVLLQVSYGNHIW